jgi:hypothetical protein
MRILFDHGTPSGIAKALSGHDVAEAIAIHSRWLQKRIGNVSGIEAETSPHFHRNQIPIHHPASLVVHRDRPIVPGARKRLGSDERQRFVVGGAQLQNYCSSICLNPCALSRMKIHPHPRENFQNL